MSEKPKPEPEQVTITTLAYELHEIRKLIAWKKHRSRMDSIWFVIAAVPMFLLSLSNFENSHASIFLVASVAFLLVGFSKR